MQGNMEQNRNRVFINPNFNKGASISDSKKQVPVMHLNPNFLQHMQNMQTVSKSKIYINPKFVEQNRIGNQAPCVNTSYYSKRQAQFADGSIVFRTEPSSKLRLEESVGTIRIPTKISSIQPIQTNSRYSLVRNKKTVHPQTVTTTPIVTHAQSNTVKINKYKSIRITDMKKKIDSVKPSMKFIPNMVHNHSSTIQTINTENTLSKIPKNHSNKYKLVRSSHSVVNKTHLQRHVSVNARKLVSSRTKFRTVGVYKKNNIPCPLYRKYGKCLRKLQGKCDFLHDKKHVSICRKFLTGVCHDTKCLLSHELSDKKMPTCYFYLNGMCTKEGCPYLHVKLNEKAKICSDFTSGYCEKGDKCLNKHVTKSPTIVHKQRHSLRKVIPQKLFKNTIENTRVKNNTERALKRRTKIKVQKLSSSQDNKDSCRYYKDSILETSCSESLDVIKPSRCKLGTLPSFIQL